MDWKTVFAADPRLGGIYQRISRPTWPTRAGVVSGLLVVVPVLAIAVLVGLLVGLAVFAVGRGLDKCGRWLGGTNRPSDLDDVRENVRVVERV